MSSSFTSAQGPKETDGKPVVTVTPATVGFVTWITGADDNPNPTPPASGRGGGNPFAFTFAGAEEQNQEFQFIEPIEIHDGQVTWRDPANWSASDTFSLGVRIPANTVTPNRESLGNCNLHPLGPSMNMIIPAAGNGAYDVDLSSAKPAFDKEETGSFWAVDYNTGNVSTGKGYNLFDFDIFTWMIKSVPMTHPMGVFDLDVYKVEYFHPSWRLVWSVKKVSPGPGIISGWIFAFRRFTF